MKIKNFDIFILFAFIPLISCRLPTFTITRIHNEESRCNHEKGYFQFKIVGKGNGITTPIRITLPLLSPENYEAVCMVSSDEIFCTMDPIIYDLSGEKVLEVYKKEPKFDNLKILNWPEYFTMQSTVLISGTNCKIDERKKDPDKEDKEYIFAIFEAKEIEILGCFRKKNNFSFKLTKIKDDKSILQKSLTSDIFFEIIFEKPNDEKALCVIPKNNDNDVYTVRCAIDYGGKIIVGKETSGIVNFEGKKAKIVFKGLLIPPTVVDECTKEKNKF